MRAVVVGVLCLVGLFFSLSGTVGIWRMPDLYTRIQASTKTITLGALPVLAALVVGTGLLTPYTSRAVVVAFLLLVLNPAASHAVARASYKTGTPQWKGAVAHEPDQEPEP